VAIAAAARGRIWGTDQRRQRVPKRRSGTAREWPRARAAAVLRGPERAAGGRRRGDGDPHLAQMGLTGP